MVSRDPGRECKQVKKEAADAITRHLYRLRLRCAQCLP
jgi:hypothetical protein